jgi:CBS domain-containing protein
MATNPRWCQSSAVWSTYFQSWLRQADPATLSAAALFFDGRIIFGPDRLTIDISRMVRRELLENRSFLVRLARSAVQDRPPLGFFRQLVCGKSGKQERRLNLKAKGLQPLVAAVRLLALEQRVVPTNTLERLRALSEGGHLEPDLAAEAVDAYQFLSRLRVQNYLTGRAMDRYSFDWLRPELLDPVVRRGLKQSFRLISRLQDRIVSRFGL